MNNIIEKLAEEATIQTQLKMIMDYPSFESQLYQEFAQKIIQECKSAINKDYYQHYEYYKKYKHTPEDVNSALDKHFGIETNE